MGLDIAATVRVFHHSKATVSRWLRRAGQHSDSLHARSVHNLHLPHVQLDEIRTRLRCRDQVLWLWLWLALDLLTKLIPTLHLGARTQETCHSLVREPHKRLAPDYLPVFTGGALPLHFCALTAHFGSWIQAMGKHKAQWRVSAG